MTREEAERRWTEEDLRAEIKRLRAEIARLTGIATAFPMTDIAERLRTSTEWAHCKHSMREEAAAEIERLRALLRRHQVAAWCEEDSDLAVETRRALEPKP